LQCKRPNDDSKDEDREACNSKLRNRTWHRGERQREQTCRCDVRGSDGTRDVCLLPDRGPADSEFR
jgi:hypothetical protein